MSAADKNRNKTCEVKERDSPNEAKTESKTVYHLLSAKETPGSRMQHSPASDEDDKINETHDTLILEENLSCE